MELGFKKNYNMAKYITYGTKYVTYENNFIVNEPATSPWPTLGLVSRNSFEDSYLSDTDINNWKLIEPSNPGVIFDTGKVGKGVWGSTELGGQGIWIDPANNTLNNLAWNGTFSIAFWFYYRGWYSEFLCQFLNNSAPVSNYAFGIIFNNDAVIHRYNSGYGTSDPITPNAWCHVAFTMNDYDGKFYVDGSLKQTNTYEKLADTPGIYSFFANFSGRLDQLYIYDRALNAAEVAVLYNNGNGI
jgi:hypothetical protein